jgi:hypothetical protein
VSDVFLPVEFPVLDNDFELPPLEFPVDSEAFERIPWDDGFLREFPAGLFPEEFVDQVGFAMNLYPLAF